MSLAHATKLLLRHQKEHEGMDRTTWNLVLMMARTTRARSAQFCLRRELPVPDTLKGGYFVFVWRVLT